MRNLRRRDGGDVKVTSKSFFALPRRLFYFEDSEVILMLESATGTLHQSTNEGQTWSQPLPSEAMIQIVVHHPHQPSTHAYALTGSRKHFKTTNAGKDWETFETPTELALDGGLGGLGFHAEEGGWVIVRGRRCEVVDWMEICKDDAFYSTDNLKTIQPLLKDVTECMWGRSHKALTTPKKESIYCVEWPPELAKDDPIFRDPSKLRIVKSTNYFKDDNKEVMKIQGGKGVLGLGVMQSFMVAAVKTRGDNGEGGLDVHVSTDGESFVKGVMPMEVRGGGRDAYTVLESSKYRLAIDVLPTPSSTSRPNRNPVFGNLYFSNSNGTYFTKSLPHTNRNREGRVDFERVEGKGVRGTILANVVDNWDQNPSEDNKHLVTKISFDDGGSWSLLRPPSTDAENRKWKCTPSAAGKAVDPKCSLHLHSTTNTHNIGRIFSTEAAPGFLLGVGNVGSYLVPYAMSDTFMSIDGGVSWYNLAKGPHKYETADQGSVVVLIPDAGSTDYILYSTQRGQPGTWEKKTLTGFGAKGEEVKKWIARFTVIDPDSTSSKMNLWVTDAEDPDSHHMLHLDLSGLQSKTCSDSDFESWTPSVSAETGDGGCLLGEAVTFMRRKADAKCKVDRKFKDPVVKSRVCECTYRDFECDFNFAPDGKAVGDGGGAQGKCVRAGPAHDAPKGCRIGEKYMGSSGYRKLPGSKCEGGVDLAKKVEVECQKGDGGIGKSPTGPGGKQPKASVKKVEGSLDNVIYLKKSPVVFSILDGGSKVWISNDEGVTWENPTVLQPILPVPMIATHDVDFNRAYFLNADEIHMTKDRLATLSKVETPVPYNRLGVPILDFHPTEPDYLVFAGGGRGCPFKDCFTEIYLTKDSGKSWLNNGKPVETWATKCVWALDVQFGKDTKLGKDAVYCASYKNKNGKVGQDVLGGKGRDDNPLQLVLITEGGKNRKVLIEKGVVSYYVVENLLVVALESGSDLKLVVSTNGETFVDAKMPPTLKIEKNAFTLLESSTGGVFMDVSQSQHYKSEYGTLFKSNSNGTFYSRIQRYSNRNDRGLVDFEKMKGIPGILVVNSVSNPDELATGAKKKVKSLISFDDGAHWESLKAPERDSEGNEISCSSAACNLNIYCKTSSYDPTSGKASSHTSEAAAGVMLAVGNVGSYLDAYVDTNTYMTKDAGRTWFEVRKDAHKWAIGDHGGLIILVDDEKPTDTLYYTWNYGDTWAEFQFSDEKVRVHSIFTEPVGTSLKFILTGVAAASKGRLGTDAVMISVDFTDVLPRKCDLPRSGGGDFVAWSPADIHGNQCFLGEEVQLWRKKPDNQCFIGREFEPLPKTEKPCECTEKDYECDYNFFHDPVSLECKLYTTDPMEPKGCKAGTTYKGSSGYRKIPLSKCKNGVDLSKPIDRICGDAHSGPGDLKTTTHMFKYAVSDYFYFNHTSTLLVRDVSDNVFISTDNGITWETPDVLKDGNVNQVLLDPYRGSRAFFIMSDKTQYYTDDNGKTIKKFEAPGPPNRLRADIVSTHPDDPNYLIWTSDTGCDAIVSTDCKAVAHVSTDGGYRWSQIAVYVVKCAWARTLDFITPSKDTVLCQVFDSDGGNQKQMGQKTKRALRRSTDAGKHWEDVFDSSIGFASYSEFLIAAILKPDESQLRLQVSLDAYNWAPAVFANDDQIPDYGYTLLDSSTGSVFLETFASRETGAEYGTLYHSNGNGTFYEISLNYVNQNHKGFTDFEKVLGIPGIALANEVTNAKDLGFGSSKKIRTVISFNDGAKWEPLVPPERDVNDHSYNCEKDCFLNLHHFTERTDTNDLFSSSSAVGLMIGVGNVGPHLTEYNDGNTFLTRDAGRTWVEITKEAHMYEFGDRGGVILLANNEVAVNTLKYSLDQGQTLLDVKISDQLGGGKLRVKNMVTEPFGSSSKFVVFGTVVGGSEHDGKTAAVHLDFEKIWSRECKLDKTNPVLSDYEAWSPSGALSGEDQCLFGKQITYYRRKQDRECRNGEFYSNPVTVEKPCACTVHDFECDVNYQRNSTGGCSPIPGFVPPAQPACVNGVRRYSTGFRKLKKTECVGGLALDKGVEEYCASPISVLGWLGILTLAAGIPAALTFGIFHLKRGGRIRLPLDEPTSTTTPSLGGFFSSSSSPSTTFESFKSTSAHVLRQTATALINLTEVLLSKSQSAYTWVSAQVQGRLRGRGGGQTGFGYRYAPVGQTALDEEIDSDPTLLDLDDY
ncbi:vacuolar protein sorting/targeting protein PEP1 [Chytridiales sp. JEL 0842]|nr:vacuolar protein sorting/targeting protein PEP1 [Chytridiales sp. JEL 0842]